jgi:hypothetical protein
MGCVRAWQNALCERVNIMLMSSNFFPPDCELHRVYIKRRAGFLVQGCCTFMLLLVICQVGDARNSSSFRAQPTILLLETTGATRALLLLLLPLPLLALLHTCVDCVLRCRKSAASTVGIQQPQVDGSAVRPDC